MTQADRIRQYVLACCVDPALALLVMKNPVLSGLPDTAIALNDPGINQSEQSAMLGLDRNRCVADKAVDRTVILKTGRVLDRQDMKAIDTRSGARRLLFDNLPNRHFAIPEKPSNPDLASAIST